MSKRAFMCRLSKGKIPGLQNGGLIVRCANIGQIKRRGVRGVWLSECESLEIKMANTAIRKLMEKLMVEKHSGWVKTNSDLFNKSRRS